MRWRNAEVTAAASIYLELVLQLLLLLLLRMVTSSSMMTYRSYCMQGG